MPLAVPGQPRGGGGKADPHGRPKSGARSRSAIQGERTSAHGGGKFQRQTRNARTISDAERLAKIQALKEVEQANVIDIKKQIAKLERILREDAAHDGMSPDLDLTDSKERKLNEVHEVVADAAPTMTLHFKFRKEGITKGAFKRGVAERANQKTLVGWAKRITTGPTHGEVWAPTSLGPDQQSLFDGMKRWLSTQGCAVTMCEPCNEADIPGYCRTFFKHS